MSFNRPQLLRPVLESLLQQVPPLDPVRLHLFQDGALPTADGATAEDAPVSECVSVFRELVPAGTVHLAERNLGVAFNFDRAERYLFQDLDSDLGYFFEDDMVVSPHYLAALDQLAAYALTEERVGYVAAYGNHHATLEQQRAWRGRVERMHHHWGFALPRRQWLRQRPVVDGYLRLIADVPYRSRPHKQIREYYRELGMPFAVTSQDGAKQFAGMLLGTARIMCSAVYGHYVGKQGLHYTPEIYDQHGFGGTVICPDPPAVFDFPDDEALARLIEEDRQEAAKFYATVVGKPVPVNAVPASGKPASLLPDDVISALYRGILGREPDPNELRSHSDSLSSGRLWLDQIVRSMIDGSEFRKRWAEATTGSEKPASLVPHMQPVELALFRRELGRPWRNYLEFGIGGSTVEAARLGRGDIVSIDTDASWIERVAKDGDVAAALAAGRLRMLHADIGKVGNWGLPLNPNDRAALGNYLATILPVLEGAQPFPDLILVDGRFRVASCLAVALCWNGSGPPPRVMMHDMGAERPHYAPILDHFEVRDCAESLVVLEPRLPKSASLLSALLQHQFDPL
ncbi:hypothetical protein [Roseomonas elaeocarpi]|uniref:Glycosyltransferase 2-like domain-containing protein n=1 Tax=Roseomonas elaeocarpi TaxID=907779 RepID=A0ABV6JXW4_9PROT